MIEYIKKDVTTVDCGIVAHGCNAQGVMGSGVAKAIRAKWPIVFERYEPYCKKTKVRMSLLGTTLLVGVEPDNPDLFVANCITQFRYGTDGEAYADLDSIRSCLVWVLNMCSVLKLPLFMPRIGCGLGGLEWDTQVGPLVEQLDQNYADNGTPVTIFVCDL